MSEQPEDDEPIGPIQLWARSVDWEKRVKAVCKPCWEIQYCPYGPLVEEFPLEPSPGDRSCRIFGHDCPVFYMAEPLTETKELRRISRSIPRPIQFKVLKRDNQICNECGKNVFDDDIHFDHIIPWSKGGPTAEHNVRLLCSSCNQRRSNRYEEEYLIESLSDHIKRPVPLSFVKSLRLIMADAFAHNRDEGVLPDAEVLAEWLELDEVTEAERSLARAIQDIYEFLSSEAPDGCDTACHQGLRFRWNFAEGRAKKLSIIARNQGLDPGELLQAEVDMVRRMGWRVELSPKEEQAWLKS